MSSLVYARPPAEVSKPISADSVTVALKPSLKILGGQKYEPPAAPYAGGGAMPALLRPRSTANLERRNETAYHAANERLAYGESMIRSGSIGSLETGAPGRSGSLRSLSRGRPGTTSATSLAASRRRRLLPETLSANELVSSLPSLAYSTYRPLDVYRGVTKPSKRGGGGSGETPYQPHGHTTQFEQQRNLLYRSWSLRERYAEEVAGYAMEAAAHETSPTPASPQHGRHKCSHSSFAVPEEVKWHDGDGGATDVAGAVDISGDLMPISGGSSSSSALPPTKATGDLLETVLADGGSSLPLHELRRQRQRTAPGSAGPLSRPPDDVSSAAEAASSPGRAHLASADPRTRSSVSPVRQERQKQLQLQQSGGAAGQLYPPAPSPEAPRGQNNSVAHFSMDDEDDQGEEYDGADMEEEPAERNLGGDEEVLDGDTGRGSEGAASRRPRVALEPAPAVPLEASRAAIQLSAPQSGVAMLIGTAMSDAESSAAHDAAQAAAATKLQIAARARQKREAELAAQRGKKRPAKVTPSTEEAGEVGSQPAPGGLPEEALPDPAQHQATMAKVGLRRKPKSSTSGAGGFAAAGSFDGAATVDRAAETVGMAAAVLDGFPVEAVFAAKAEQDAMCLEASRRSEGDEQDEPPAVASRSVVGAEAEKLEAAVDGVGGEQAAGEASMRDDDLAEAEAEVQPHGPTDAAEAEEEELSALAVEADNMVSKLSGMQGLAKRRSYLQPKHALDGRQAKGWRSLSPTKQADASSPPKEGASKQEVLAAELEPASAATIVDTGAACGSRAETTDTDRSDGISPPSRRPNPPLSEAGQLIVPAAGDAALGSASSIEVGGGRGNGNGSGEGGGEGGGDDKERRARAMKALLASKIQKEKGGMSKHARALLSKKTLNMADVSAAFLRSKQIASALRSAPEFAKLTDPQIGMLAQGGEERRVPRYTILYREGASAASFYVLLKGRLQHSTFHSSAKHEVSAPATDGDHRGTCLGTEGLSGGLRRLTTVTTLDECLVLRFATAGMRIDESGAASLAARASSQVVAAALRGNQFFEAMSERTRQELAPHFKLVEVGEAGVKVLEEGGPADKMCLLLEGSVGVFVGGNHVSDLPDSDDDPEPVFGEAALLSNDPSAETIVTLEPCKLLVLHRPKFRKLLALMPDLRDSLRTRMMLRKGFVAAAVRAKEEQAGAIPSLLEGAEEKAFVREHLSREQAATCIQRYARGKQARTRVKLIRTKRS